MPKTGQKNFNVNIEEKLAIKFDDQITMRGYTKYRAIEGALRLWLTLTPHEQVALIEGKLPMQKMEGNRIEQLKLLLREFVRISELPATPEAKISAKKGVKRIAGHG